DPDAIFVMRFAGAFNVAAQAKIILANGAKRCNVFWLGGAGVATGAVNIGAGAHVTGIFISHGGACNSGAGVFLGGAQYSTLGAVNSDTAVIYNNPECITSTPLAPNPALGLVKTASIGGTGTGLLGEVITYTYTVTNTGPEALLDVVVTDLMEGLTINGGPIASLGIVVSNSDITGTYTITAADVVACNVTSMATATATAANFVTDISGTANDNDDPTVTTLATPIERWRLENFGSTANSGNGAVASDLGDSDTLDNLLEFAFGTDPNVIDNSLLTVSGGTFTLGTPTMTAGTDTIISSYKAQFVRRIDHAKSGLTYRAQFSSDLINWEDSMETPMVVVEDLVSGYAVVEVPYMILSTGKEGRFFQITVNSTEGPSTPAS
ncbi:MAG: putative repeat protein (TIGR01451 family), partial [Verrucomicrobiales bacterium]